MRLHLGCGRDIKSGWINLDHVATPGVDVVADLESCASSMLPFKDDSIEEMLMSHVLEHIRNTLPLMAELHRVAKHDALLTVRVPYGASNDAWEDPTHVRAYFQGSFGYFSQPYYWRADYGYRGDWQPKEIVLHTIKKEGEGIQSTFQRVRSERNVVTEMVATLRAVKPIREPRRELIVAPSLVIT